MRQKSILADPNWNQFSEIDYKIIKKQMVNCQRKVNPYSVHGCFCVNVCKAFRSSNKLVQSKNVYLQGYRFQHQISGSEIPNGDGAE